MVYKLFFNDGISEALSKRGSGALSSKSTRQVYIQAESKFIKLMIGLIKFLLFTYDILSLPIYFILQRPDKRAYEAKRKRSERVDINTWIKSGSNKASYFLPSNNCKFNLGVSSSSEESLNPNPRKYMGATVNEIFSNATGEYSLKPCLGYRAVVTCPVLTQNEVGEHVLQDKSFRSDYTWYTYEQIGRRVQDIASGLYKFSVYPGSRALFFANTSLEWFIAAQACFQLAAQLVVAPEIYDDLSLKLILKEAEVNIIFVSCDRLPQLCKLLENLKQTTASNLENLFSLKSVVLIDWQFSVDFNEPIFAQLLESSSGVIKNILSMGQVEESGVENPVELSCTKFLNQDPEDFESLIQIRQTSHRQSRPSTPNPLIKNIINSQLKRTKTSSNISERVDGSQFQSNLAVDSSAGLRRRSATSSSTSSVEDIRRRIRKTSATNSPTADLSYTLTNKNQIDSKSTSPKISSNSANILKRSASNFSAKTEDLGMILYTHGPIGQIKAIMITHGYLARCSRSLFLDGLVNEKDVHCTTLSLDNIIEFMTELCVFSCGGSIGYSSNPNTLFHDGKELFKRDISDLEALKPTFLLVRPYILERLRTSMQNYISLQINPLKSLFLTNVIYDYKKYWARRYFETPIVDRIFCFELKRLFGQRLKFILCNGATDCSETKDFFAFILDIPVIELYGPDEAIVSLISVNDVWDRKRRIKNESGGYKDFIGDETSEATNDFENMQLMPPLVNLNTFKEDTFKNLLITSSILCPTLETRIRLEDWEDFRTSNRPFPRGRLVIGGDVVCKGYYKRPMATNEAFYTDSNHITWFRTNDIARVFPNGSFEIISAITDMIKMVDGQFISLSQIEHILRNSQFVENVCAICGDDRKFVIALIVPNLRRLALKSPGEAGLKMAIAMEPEPEELIDIEFRREVCNDRLLCEFVNEHLNELIAKAGFHSIPSRFYLVPEIWTPETELVTPSFEPKRSAIQKYYATEIQSIFRMRLNPCSNRLSARLAKPRKFSNPL